MKRNEEKEEITGFEWEDISTEKKICRVRLYDKETYMERVVRTNGNNEYHYMQSCSYMYAMEGSFCNPRTEPPFHDPESTSLLERFGYTVAENEWYTVYYKGERMPMEWLPEECKYALTLIDRSRRGDYLSFPHEHWYRRKMNTILHLMKDFPFAIRLVACHAGHGLVRTVPAPRPYLIENFPFHGKTIEVLVISESQKAPQGYVVETIQEEGIPWTYELRCTEKGQYFIQENVRDVTYYWKNDIRGILQKLEQFSKKKKNYLLDSVQCCSLHEFAKNITDGTAYFNGGARKEFSRRFTDQYMIINHLRMEPRFVGRRGILIVDVNRDGTYLIHGHLTYSMLNLARIMRQMITEMEPDMTRYTLIVSNMFENLEFLKDSTPMLGIRQEEYCMELFEPDEAMEIFGKILKEAYQSGRCIVSCARNS